MLKVNIFSNIINIKFYNIPKKNFICSLIKNFLFKLFNLNICFVNLLSIYMLNKFYKYSNFPTNLLTFKNFNYILINNELILCPLIIEKESFTKNLNLFLYYFFIIMHGLMHTQNIHHYIIFQKNLSKFIFKKNLFKLKKHLK